MIVVAERRSRESDPLGTGERNRARDRRRSSFQPRRPRDLGRTSRGRGDRRRARSRRARAPPHDHHGFAAPRRGHRRRSLRLLRHRSAARRRLCCRSDPDALPTPVRPGPRRCRARPPEDQDRSRGSTTRPRRSRASGSSVAWSWDRTSPAPTSWSAITRSCTPSAPPMTIGSGSRARIVRALPRDPFRRLVQRPPEAARRRVRSDGADAPS